ncbi:hypothetical protein PAP10c_p1130 (plasmid) [Pantoea agglomerans]|nr:hypothetical protein PAP10c_p1130 [Pantoea agglomerans]
MCSVYDHLNLSASTITSPLHDGSGPARRCNADNVSRYTSSSAIAYRRHPLSCIKHGLRSIRVWLDFVYMVKLFDEIRQGCPKI